MPPPEISLRPAGPLPPAREAPARPLVVVDRPFGAPVTLERPAGLSVAELVDTAPLDDLARRHAVVLIGDETVPRALWARVRPKAGTLVTVAMRPAGGDDGRKILREILHFAVRVAAGVTSFFFGPWAALAVYAIGTMAVNALLPPPRMRERERPAPSFSIDGQRNEARPWEPVPLALGEVRMVPPLLAAPIQEIVGDQVYLRMAVCWGPTPVQLADLRIGETPITAFADVEIEHRLTATAPPHLLIAGDVQQDGVGVTLSTTFTQRVTQPNVDEIAVFVTFPAGLGAYDSKNRKQARTVTLELEWRPAGVSGAPWRTARPAFDQGAVAGRDARDVWNNVTIGPEVDRYAGALPGGTASGPIQIRRADPGRPVRHVERWVVPRGQYEVRLRRTNAATTDPSAVDDCAWSVLESRVRGADAFPNRALASTCLRIRASEQLQGVIDQLNARVTRLAPVLTAGTPSHLAGPTTWSTLAATRNPADLALWLVRGAHAPRPVPDAEIDWPAWAEFRAFCAAQGFACDLVLADRMRRSEALDLVCGPSRARVRRIDGRLTVVIDRPRPAPVQLITPRTARDLRVTRAIPPRTQGLRVTFANRFRGFRQDERIVTIDGFTPATAEDVEAIEAPGVTDPDHVWRYARHLLATRTLQLETAECGQDIEHLMAPFGSLVLVAHDTVGVGHAQALVTAVTLDGFNRVTALTLDTPVDLPAADLQPGESWGARIRRITLLAPGEHGVAVDTAIALNPTTGPTITLVPTAPIPAAQAPEAGDLLAIGRTDRVAVEMLVAGVEPGDDLSARLTLVAYAPERYAWSAGTPPPFVSLLGDDAGAPAAATIVAAYVDAEGTKVAFTVPGDREFAAVKVRWRDSPPPGESTAWETAPDLSPAARLAVVPAPLGQRARDVELVLVDSFGRQSPPAIVQGLVSGFVGGIWQGPTAPPVVVDGDTWWDTSLTPIREYRRVDGAWVLVQQLGADVTSLHTAAAIAGQGDLATRNGSTLPIGGANLLVDAQMLRSLTHRAALSENVPAAPALLQLVDAFVGVFVQVRTPTLPALAGGSFYGVALARAAIADEGVVVEGGGRIGFRMGVSMAVASGAVTDTIDFAFVRFMGFRLTDGVWDTSVDVALPRVTELQSFTHVFDAPLTRRWVVAVWIRVAAGVAVRAELNVWQPGLWRLVGGQTEVPPWSESVSADRRADVTAANTAAAITGQGPLATASLTPAQVQGRFLGSFASEADAVAAGLQDGDTYIDTGLNALRGRSPGGTTTVPGGGGPPAARAGQATVTGIGVNSGTWTTAVSVTLGDVAAGLADVSQTALLAVFGTTAITGVGDFNGEWRIRRAGTVIASGTWVATDTGGGVEVDPLITAPASVAAGAATYDLQLRRASGTTTISGLDARLYVSVTQS